MASAQTQSDPELQEARFARRDRRDLEVEVLRLEQLLKPPFNRATTAPTRTLFHSLLLVDAGNARHHVDFESYPAVPGDLLIIPKGHVQAFDPERGLRGSAALFTANFLEGCNLGVQRLAESSRLLMRAGVRIHLGEDSFRQAQQVFTMLSANTRTANTNYFADETVTSAFSLMIFTLSGLPETAASIEAQATYDELVTRFQGLLEHHYREQHLATWYSAELDVSVRTLDRRNIIAQGQTTRQCITARLVLEAKRLLTAQDASIKNIAYELGFSEPQNFTRFFREQIGTSPQAFRNSL
ncbi:MAG: AraC family transcriptional regulator [Pseudomonadota bacterium]